MSFLSPINAVIKQQRQSLNIKHYKTTNKKPQKKTEVISQLIHQLDILSQAEPIFLGTDSALIRIACRFICHTRDIK